MTVTTFVIIFSGDLGTVSRSKALRWHKSSLSRAQARYLVAVDAMARQLVARRAAAEHPG